MQHCFFRQKSYYCERRFYICFMLFISYLVINVQQNILSWFGFGLWQKIMTSINLYDNNEPSAVTRATFIYYSRNKLGREYVYVNIA